MKQHGRFNKQGLAARVLIAVAIALCAVLFAARAPLGRTADAYAAPEKFNEYAVKAAFLFNFARFIEWPRDSFENARTPLTICIVGVDPFEGNIDFLENNTIKGRRLRVRRLPAEEDFRQCNAVFIGRTEQGRIPRLLDSARGGNILTVGEVKNFCRAGGVINLYLENNMVRFEINVDAAERAGLTISSELLRLSRIVREDRK